jgi:DNA-binding NtrC family response regulator
MDGRVLVVDDDPHVQYTLRATLAAKGFDAAVVPSAEAALERLRAEPFDVVLLDVMLGDGMSGMKALPLILRADADLPVILMTAYGSREMAYEAIQKGAYDFFEKPFKVEELTIVLRRALERRRLVREVSELTQRLGADTRIESLIAQSPAMKPVLANLGVVGNTDVLVLLLGENGTGKTLIARALHDHSPRRAGPFVTVPCAALPETLLESELFGYEPGAFTGAVRRKPGKFEAAEGGTIFLDEIGDLPLSTQAKLLRVIENRECEHLGGTETIHLDARTLAATNRDLEKEVAAGTFRQDLFYRLNVFPIYLPPLRERREDLPLLVEHFVRQHARTHHKRVSGFTPAALQLLLDYDWPGNVRELDHVVQQCVLRALGEMVDAGGLPAQVVTYKPRVPDKPAVPQGTSLDDLLGGIERQAIEDALKRTGGVQKRAARLLRVTERSLWHRVKKYGINVGDIKEPPPE